MLLVQNITGVYAEYVILLSVLDVITLIIICCLFVLLLNVLSSSMLIAIFVETV